MKKSYIVPLLIMAILLFWFIDDSVSSPSSSHAVLVKEQSLQKTDANNALIYQAITSVEGKPAAEQPLVFNENIANAAQQVANEYQKSLTFPPYSQPLSLLDEDRLKPNQFHPVVSPIDSQGQNLTLNVSQYRFIYPDNIYFTVSADQLEHVTVELSNTDTKEVLKASAHSVSKGEVSLSVKGQQRFPRNLQLRVDAKVNGKIIPVVAQLQYMLASATLVSIDSAYAENDNMIIPANLTVLNPGLYRIRANLYNGKQPVAHLVARESLQEGTQILAFKAHWSVLPPGVSTFNLKDFVIERMSPSPGERNSFGNSDITDFIIEDFVYDSLQQIPYQANKQEKLSLKFLQKLAENG